jgi:hypothetical protein
MGAGRGDPLAERHLLGAEWRPASAAATTTPVAQKQE